MTREETAELLAVIKVAYPQQLGKLSDFEANAMVNLWADEFASVPKEVMHLATKSIVKKLKFFPSVADMCEELNELNRSSYSRLICEDCDSETKRKLEFIRQSTADFAVTKMMEHRADGAKDWLFENLKNKQLQLGGELNEMLVEN